jgi:dUTP pyrophosphatase
MKKKEEKQMMDSEYFAVMKKPVVKLLQTSDLAVLPVYSKDGDAGADVYSVSRVILMPGKRALIDLGFCIEIETGWEIQVRSRSGLAIKNGVTVLNSPGTIDSGYRGQCGVILQNSGEEPFLINAGDRVAQFVLKRAPQASFVWTNELSNSDRGKGGFGSTGT